MAHYKLTWDEAAEKIANIIRDEIDISDALQVVFDYEYDFYKEQPGPDLIEAFEEIFQDDTLELTD